MLHSTVDPTAEVFNETADSLCEVGYSVDEKPHQQLMPRLSCARRGSGIFVEILCLVGRLSLNSPIVCAITVREDPSCT